MTNRERAEMLDAARALGPAKCRRALKAWKMRGEGWVDCPLACAYGEPGDLEAVLEAGSEPTLEAWIRRTGALLGIGSDAALAVQRYFDYGGDYRVALRNALKTMAHER